MKCAGPRLGLLIALLPLLLACVPLVMFFPSDGSRVHWIDKSSQQAVFEFVSYRARSNTRPLAQVLSLELNSGELRRLPIDEHSLAESYHFGDGKLHWQSYPDGTALFGASHRATNSPTRRCDLTTIDLKTGKIERASTLEDLGAFPISGRMQMLIDRRRVSVLDLDRVGTGWHDLEGVTNAADAAAIPSSNRFMLVDPTYTSDDETTKSNRLALYEINPSGDENRVADWPISSSGRDTFWCFLANGSEFASLSPDRQQIEVHSSQDGSLLRRQPVPAGLTRALRSETLTSRLVSTTLKNRRAFDIERGEWLPSPPGDHWIEDESIENGLVLYRNDSKFEEFSVLDRSTNKVVCRFTVDYGSEARFLDAQRIAVMSFHYGMTVRVIDALSGETVSLYRPFFWIVPALIALLIGYGAWSTAWIVVAARAGAGVVSEIVVVAGIPTVVLIMRIAFGGPHNDIRRTPIQCLHGMALAGAMLLAAWIVFGQRRLSLRALALMTYGTLLFAVLALTYFHESQLAWIGIASVMAPALVLTLPLSVLHALGWRVERVAVGAIGDQPSVCRIDTGVKFHLRDLLAGTFVVAVLFAVTRSIHDTLGSLVEINYIQWPMLGAQAIGLITLFAALWRRTRWTFPLAIMMMVAAVSYLGQESIASLARAGQSPFLNSDFDARHSLLACLATMFVVQVPLRLRGWQLRNCSGRHFLSRRPVSRSKPS